MKLLDIKNPEFLKVLTIDELNELASDIREYIIEVISKNGGHLSSNLSLVELTIALHTIFNAPQDKIIFDTAYACYTHKILTGRVEEFKNIRRNGGISGFFNPKESVYDIFNPSLTANNLKAIEGMAISDKSDNQIVVVIDNESIDNGDIYESLCRLSNLNRKVIVIYNDNDDSNSQKHVLSKIVSKVSNNSRYISLKRNLDDVLSKYNSGEDALNSLNSVKHNLKEHIFNMPKIFEDLKLDYIGPVDGHDIYALLKTLKKASIETNSCFVHVKTICGKGLNYIENGQKLNTCLCKAFDVSSGKDLVDTPKDYFSFNGHLNRYLNLLMERFDDIHIISTAEVYDIGFMQLYSDYKERFTICKNNPNLAFEIAKAMAINGKKVIVLVDAYLFREGYNAYLDIINAKAAITICVYNAGLKAFIGNDLNGVDVLASESALNHYPITFASDFKELELLLIKSYHADVPYVINYSEGIFKYHNYEIAKPHNIWRHIIAKEKPKAYVLTYGRSINMFKEDIELNDLNIDLINLLYINQIDETLMDEIIKSNQAIIIYDESKDSQIDLRIKNYLFDKNATNKVKVIKICEDIAIGSLSSMRKQLDYIKVFKELDIYD